MGGHGEMGVRRHREMGAWGDSVVVCGAFLGEDEVAESPALWS